MWGNIWQQRDRFHCAAWPSFRSWQMSREWESYVYKGSSFRPDTDIKSSTTGLFHCVHSAARQLSKLYCKHCVVLLSLSIMPLSTFSPWQLMHSPWQWFKVYFGGGSLPSTITTILPHYNYVAKRCFLWAIYIHSMLYLAC